MATAPSSSPLRLAFFGTPDFAVPTLERLIEGRHEVVTVVCQPDRRRGRGRKTSPAPVAEVALSAGVPLMRRESVADDEGLAEFRAHKPDLGVVVAFGQFLPKRIREAPALGYLINGHASLLPRYRGAAPIARCLLDGATVTGVSAMRVEREMDSGPVALQRKIEIGEHENAGELSERLSKLTADTLEGVIEQIADNRVSWVPQDDTRATFAPKIRHSDGQLIWTESAQALCRRVRAMAPSPGAFTTFEGESLQILDARSDESLADVAPGTVRMGPARELRIATGDGWVLPRILQRPGRRALGVEVFVRGRPIPDGTLLG
ncbi:MAG: methionyl-tRNA formyltransferase [Myxococcota bacterium]